MQIHHIDDNPANHDTANLAVLCLDCHTETQRHGGFSRGLDADQVALYRNDWHQIVARERVERNRAQSHAGEQSEEIEFVTSTAEALRENAEYQLLAMYYDSVGNADLRDKYIEIALESDRNDSAVVFLRGLQGRPDLVPEDVAERHIARHTEVEDWLQRARAYQELGCPTEAAQDYVRGVHETLEQGNYFSAAYYLKELVGEDLIEHLFKLALDESVRSGNLWWQVRALEELGWWSELDQLVLENDAEIRRQDDPHLLSLLLEASGDRKGALAERKRFLTGMRVVGADDSSVVALQPDDE